MSELVGTEFVEINSNIFSAQSRPRFYWTNIDYGKIPNRINDEKIYDILENPLHNSHSLIKFIKDRKGHDFRYGINNNKLKALGFLFNDNFEKNISTTIKWYIENKKWLLKKKLKY